MMRANRVYVRFAAVLSALLLVVSACEPYASDPVSPDVQYAKGGNGNGNGGGGEDGSDGRFGFRIGYDSPYTGAAAPGVVNATGSATRFMSSTVTISDNATDVGYLQDRLGLTCFPDLYETGSWTFTDGRAEFNFAGLSADGSVSKSYVLALTGGGFVSTTGDPAWPLVEDPSRSFFNATAWTLTPQGKGKKNPGCEDGSTFQADGEAPVRVGVGRGSLDPPSVKVVSPFLNSPFNLTNPPVPTRSIFDHSPYDGQVIDYTGTNVGTDFGYDGSTYYYFALDIGTDIVAAASGTVIWVGNDPPHYCSGRVVTDQLFVVIEHEVPADDGGFQRFATVYKRLQNVSVAVGQVISPGNLIVIGETGMSGCSSYASLVFGVRVERPGGMDYETSYYRDRTDPYGPSLTTDPVGGVLHQVLWVDGQAPPLIPVIH